MPADTFLTMGLNQWITEQTFHKSGNILDIVLTSEPDCMGSLEVMAPLLGCDHSAISFDYIFSKSSHVRSIGHPASHRDWYKGKHRMAGAKLSNIDWDLELADLDIDQSYKQTWV